MRRLDQAQHSLAEGPCLDAARGEQTYLIPDTTNDERWPRWSAEAAANGVRSVLSAQLEGPNPLAAALNLYSKTLDAFDVHAVVTAQIDATHAGNAIAANSENEQLAGAMQTRHLIGMAQGMLIFRYHLSEPQAFQFLARNSQDRNIKLREVAAQVVAELAEHRWPTDLRPAPGDG